MKRIGLTVLRHMTTEDMKTLDQTIAICSDPRQKSDPVAILIPYQMYMEQQHLTQKLREQSE